MTTSSLPTRRAAGEVAAAVEEAEDVAVVAPVVVGAAVMADAEDHSEAGAVAQVLVMCHVVLFKSFSIERILC